MPSQLEQIRDQQRETWDKFSSGWKRRAKIEGFFGQHAGFSV
jgi:hypothetical protein